MFDPIEFQHLGNQLLDDDDYHSESRFRTSIGRAYYSSFLVIREWLMTNRKRKLSKGARVHRQVIEELKKINNQISQELNYLRDTRNNADYQLDTEINDELARDCIEISNRIITAAQNNFKSQ
jgi:uncharacterized protein (UPF0332 family)